MANQRNHQESYRIAAEKMRLKKEKEEREDREYYERSTSGMPWLMFKLVVAFCTLMIVVSTIEVLFDGPTKKLSEKSWKIDRTWEFLWHKVLDVEGCMFTPTIEDWSKRTEKSLKMTYSPIFHTAKTLSFNVKEGESIFRKQEEINQRSIFTWFPAFQIFLLIPLVTFIFKRQNAFFNFARIASFVVILPGTLLVLFFAML